MRELIGALAIEWRAQMIRSKLWEIRFIFLVYLLIFFFLTEN